MAASRFASLVDLGIPALPGDNVSREMFDEFYRLYNAINQLHKGLVQYTGMVQIDPAKWSVITPANTLYAGNLRRLYVKAGAALSYGDTVNLYNVSGVLQARKAVASSGSTYCNAICSTLGGIASGEYGEVILLEGLLQGLAGLTPGVQYYLHPSTSGAFTATRPSTAGQIIQPVGIALSPTEFYFSAHPLFIQL